MRNRNNWNILEHPLLIYLVYFFRSSENVSNLYVLIWQILEHVQVNFGDVKCPGESEDNMKNKITWQKDNMKDEE